MTVMFSALRASRPLSQGKFLMLISVSGRIKTKVILRLDGLDQLKNPISTPGIEATTFRLVAFFFSKENRTLTKNMKGSAFMSLM
jgi:hypothetical protein